MTSRGSSATYPSPPTSCRQGQDLILMHFKQKNKSASWQIMNPVYSQPSVPAGAFSRRAREGVSYIITQLCHLAPSVKYVCGKCLKCMLAIQQTRTAQLEKSRVITILVTVVLLSQITGPSLSSCSRPRE